MRQGRKVCVFKCGPDFLDPYWHELASGNPVHSVDLWMTGEADVRQRLHEAAQSADLILVEGVMGLFDGNLSAAGSGSAPGFAGAGRHRCFGDGRHFRGAGLWIAALPARLALGRHAGQSRGDAVPC